MTDGGGGNGHNNKRRHTKKDCEFSEVKNYQLLATGQNDTLTPLL